MENEQLIDKNIFIFVSFAHEGMVTLIYIRFMRVYPNTDTPSQV
jgi:hypothetical protein